MDSTYKPSEFLSYGKQWIDDADIAAVTKTLMGEYLTQGPAVAEFEEAVDARAVLAGLAATTLPARFQVLDREPPVVLDGAHTPDSVRLGLETFERLFPGPKALLFACAIDKKHAEMAAALAPRFQQVTVTRPGTFKQSDPGAVLQSFRVHFPGAAFLPETADAVLAARDAAAAAGIPLLVTGSFYLCAEASKLLE